MKRALALVAVAFGALVGGVLVLGAVGAIHAYRIPSSAMEPTLHCARPAVGCGAGHSDRMIGLSWGARYGRGDIAFFETPLAAEIKCGAGGTFVKRIIGLPGETVQIRVIHGAGYVYINGEKLDEPYIQQERRDMGPAKTYHVPPDQYFVMGDNRASSCDSRTFGSVPADNLKAKRVVTYWPPNRISFR